MIRIEFGRVGTGVSCVLIACRRRDDDRAPRRSEAGRLLIASARHCGLLSSECGQVAIPRGYRMTTAAPSVQTLAMTFSKVGADAQSQVTGRSACAGRRARARGGDSRRTVAATRRGIPAPVAFVGVIQAPVGGGPSDPRPSDMERPVNPFRYLRVTSKSGHVMSVAIERLLRRLITLIYAGRDRMVVIRRELPRTKRAGPARRPAA